MPQIELETTLILLRRRTCTLVVCHPVRQREQRSPLRCELVRIRALHCAEDPVAGLERAALGDGRVRCDSPREL